MAIRMYYVWKSKLRLYGAQPGNISNKLKSDIRNSITVVTHFHHPQKFEDSYEPFYYFLLNSSKRYAIRNRFRHIFS